MIQVYEMMTKNPHTLTLEATLADVLAIMEEKDIRHVPIVDGAQTLKGLVSQRDALAVQESLLTRVVPKENESSIPVTRFMTTNVSTVTTQAGLREAAMYIQKHRYGCLPVVDHRKLVGIITESDFVEVAINLLEIIEDQSLPEADQL